MRATMCPFFLIVLKPKFQINIGYLNLIQKNYYYYIYSGLNMCILVIIIIWWEKKDPSFNILNNILFDIDNVKF